MCWGSCGGPCTQGHPDPQPRQPHLTAPPACASTRSHPRCRRKPSGVTSALGTSRLRPPASAAPPPPTPLPGMGGTPLPAIGPRHPPPPRSRIGATAIGTLGDPICSSSATWAPWLGPPITRLGRGWPMLGADGPCWVLVTHTGCSWCVLVAGGPRWVLVAHARCRCRGVLHRVMVAGE